MIRGGLWGLAGASSLIVGAILAFGFDIPKRVLGILMAFGAGVLISAVAFDLVEEAFDTSGGTGTVASGLALGALAFYFGDLAIDRMGGEHRKRSSGAQAEGSALAIVLGIVLDGIPESVVIGVSLLGGGGVSFAVLAAVFLSNVPEAVAATSGLESAGWRRGRLLALWVVVTAASGLAAGLGYGLLGSAPQGWIALSQAFAGGAILTMLADTMMPEAFEYGGALVGLFTVLGFALAFLLTTIET